MDLAGQVLEEAVELVEVAVGVGRKRAGSASSLGARDVGHLDHQLVAEALDPPAHAHEVAALKAPGQGVGVAEGPGGHRAAARRAARAPDTASRCA